MTVPKNDTYKDYVRYAEHCLNMMAGTTDKESRRIQCGNGGGMAKTGGCDLPTT